MKTNKKILAVIIAAALVITLLPSMAFAAEEYDVWVGDTQVTSDNLSGTGWSYDPSSKTLTLNSAGITSISTGPDGYKANIYAKNMDLTINLSGENTVIGGYYGIVVYGGGLRLKGDGKLEVKAEHEEMVCLSAEKDLIIESAATVEAMGEIVASGNVSIDNSCVTVFPDDTGHGGISSHGFCSITNSSVKASNGEGMYGITSGGHISIINSRVEASGFFSGADIKLVGSVIIDPKGAELGKVGGSTTIVKDGAPVKEAIIEPDPKWHHIKGVTAIQNGGDYMEGADILPPGASEGEDVAVGIHLASAKVPPAKLYYKTADETETDIPFTVGGEKNDFVSGSFKMPASDVEVIAEWEAPTCTVKFETNGGTAVVDQTVKKGEKAAKPEDPTRDGYKLLDWFEDEACTKRFDFTKAIDGDTTVYAYWAKLVNGFKLHADGTEKDSGGKYKLKTDALEVLFEKDTAKVEIEVSPLSTDRDNANQLTEAPEKDKEYWFHAVITDVDGVEDETLGRPTIWTGDEMKAGLDATAEDAVITLDEVMHSPAGKYTTLIFKYKENKPAPEPEPEPEPEPQPEPEPVPEVKPVYWVSEGTDLTVSEDSADGLKLTVHRKPGDDLTFSLFTGVEMDGKQLSSSDYTAASGSLKLTVKSSCIKGLAVGSHTFKVKFSDGEVTANVKVTEANDNPKTGDESGLMLWMLIAVIAAGGIIAALLVYRKQSKRE